MKKAVGELGPATCGVEEALGIRELGQKGAGDAAQRVKVVAVRRESGSEYQDQGKERHRTCQLGSGEGEKERKTEKRRTETSGLSLCPAVLFAGSGVAEVLLERWKGPRWAINRTGRCYPVRGPQAMEPATGGRAVPQSLS